MNRRRRRRKKQQIPPVIYQMSKKEIAGWGVIFFLLFILAPYAFYTNFHIFMQPAGITAIVLMLVCTISSYSSIVKRQDLADMTIIETAVAIAEHFWVMVLIIAALIIIDAAISTSYSIWTGLLVALPGSIFLSAGLSSPAIFLTTILLRFKAG